MESKAKDYCIRAAIALLLVMLTGISAWAQDPASIGSIQYNSTLGAYEINSVQNLNDLAVYVNGRGTYSTSGDETTAHSCSGLTFKQTADITYTGTGNYTPIGLFVNEDGFQGTFDGQGNTISGIDCTGDGLTGEAIYLGLFGWNQGTVRNVTLSGCRFASANNENDDYNDDAIYVHIGSIAGENDYTGTITGCTVTGGTVSRTRTANANRFETPIGGIAGHNNGSITDCTYSGSVSGTYSGSHTNKGCYFRIGGIAGVSANGGSITGCGSDAAVSCSAPNVSGPWLFVGGIAGLNNGAYGDAAVSDCFFSGTLSGTGKTGSSTYSIYIGAFVGRSINSSIVTNNYYYGDYASTIGYEGGDGTLANLVRVYQLTGNSITATAPQGSGTIFKGVSYFKADATVTLAPQAGYAITAASYNDGSEDHDVSGKTFEMPANDVTVTATTIPLSGTCGYGENDDVNWAVTDTDDDGTYDKLTISGTGDMANYGSNQPWAAFKSDITTAVIEDGVNRIGMRDFYQHTALTSVSIASSVTIIDPAAFGECTNLATISGATGVTYVGSSAFSGTAWLDALYYAQSDGLTYVGHVAFLFKGTDTSVNLDAGTTQIYDNCFIGSRITSIIIPASVTTIGDNAFAHSDILQKIYVLRSGSEDSDITQLGEGAFFQCHSLAAIIVPADAYSSYRRGLWYLYMSLLQPGFTITCEEGITATTYGPLVTEYEKVTLSHNDRADYAFNGYSVKDSENYDVTVYEEDGVYTFWMPDANVTVSATWEPANKITVTANKVGSNYWTTFYCGEAGYCIDEEVEAIAYTATVDNSTITLHMLGKVIPMGTAAIIISKDNSISMNRDDYSIAEFCVDNNLHGVDVRTLKSTLDNTGTGTFYVLGKKDADFGFFEYTADYMPARKAYLLVDDSPAETKGLRMVIEDEETSLSEELRVKSEEFATAVYDLSGRRISNGLKKGIYIINGKKVLK